MKRIVLWRDGQAADVEVGGHFEAEHRARGFVEAPAKAPAKATKKKATKKKATKKSRMVSAEGFVEELAKK